MLTDDARSKFRAPVSASVTPSRAVLKSGMSCKWVGGCVQVCVCRCVCRYVCVQVCVQVCVCRCVCAGVCVQMGDMFAGETCGDMA